MREFWRLKISWFIFQLLAIQLCNSGGTNEGEITQEENASSCHGDNCKEFYFTSEDLKEGRLSEKVEAFLQQRLKKLSSENSGFTLKSYVGMGDDIPPGCSEATTSAATPTTSDVTTSDVPTEIPNTDDVTRSAATTLVPITTDVTTSDVITSSPTTTPPELQTVKPVVSATSCSAACLLSIVDIVGASNQPVGFSTRGVLSSLSVGESNVTVYCDCSSSVINELVFQRRVDDTINFDRTLEEYENGFGNWTGNFWIGLKNLRLLTQGPYKKLSIKVSRNGQIHIKDFSLPIMIGESDENYTMYVDSIGIYSAKSGDYIWFTDGGVFGVRDSPSKCNGKSGWWFTENSTYHCSLNGPYEKNKGVKWFSINGGSGLKWFDKVEMRLGVF